MAAPVVTTLGAATAGYQIAAAMLVVVVACLAAGWFARRAEGWRHDARLYHDAWAWQCHLATERERRFVEQERRQRMVEGIARAHRLAAIRAAAPTPLRYARKVAA